MITYDPPMISPLIPRGHRGILGVIKGSLMIYKDIICSTMDLSYSEINFKTLIYKAFYFYKKGNNMQFMPKIINVGNDISVELPPDLKEISLSFLERFVNYVYLREDLVPDICYALWIEHPEKELSLQFGFIDWLNEDKPVVCPYLIDFDQEILMLDEKTIWEGEFSTQSLSTPKREYYRKRPIKRASWRYSLDKKEWVFQRRYKESSMDIRDHR